MMECNLSPSFLVKGSKLFRIIKDIDRAEQLIDDIADVDETFYFPRLFSVPFRGGYSLALQCPIFGQKSKKDNTVIIKPKRPELCLEIVQSSFKRWVLGYGTRITDYFLDGEKIVSTWARRKSNFPLSGLTSSQKEEYTQLLYDNWIDIVTPILVSNRKDPTKIRRIFEIFPPKEEIFEISLSLEDSELLDQYPTYDSLKTELSLQQSYGVFVSNFCYYTRPEEVFRILLLYISVRDALNILSPLAELMKGVEKKSVIEKSIIATRIYILFSVCEKNCEIFFRSFLEDYDSEFENIFPELEKCFPRRLVYVLQNHLDEDEKDEEQEQEQENEMETNPKKIPDIDFEGWEPKKIKWLGYEGLIWGPRLQDLIGVDSEFSDVYEKDGFYNEFYIKMRCSNPIDIPTERGDSLYSQAMEVMFSRNYYGFLQSIY